jgi:molybdopterin/thiamine biosynthesis adenylyltransferase
VNPLLTRLIEAQRAVMPIGKNPLANRKVAVVGLGSLGSLLAESVVRLGFAHALLLDRDIVDQSNLYRQTLYDTDVLGKPKAVAAEQRLLKIGSKTELVALVEHLSARNADRLLSGYDFILCAVDNTAGRIAINQHCLRSGTHWAYGGAIGYRGEATLFAPPEGPCYACLFPKPVGIPKVDPRNCTRDGILLPTVMAVASYVIFLALSTEPAKLAGRRYMFNGSTLQNTQKQLSKNPSCPACSGNGLAVSESLSDSWPVEFICGNSAQVVPNEDLHLDLAAIAGSQGPAVHVSDWYLHFQLGVREVFLWQNGRLVVTNVDDASEVKRLFRELTGKGEVP